MSHYSSPEELAANPPESWRVIKRGERSWGLHIDPSYEHPVETFTTKREALEARDNPTSYIRRAVESERLWYEGVTPAGHNSYAECLAKRAKNDAWQAARRAERESNNPNYRPEQWP